MNVERERAWRGPWTTDNFQIISTFHLPLQFVIPRVSRHLLLFHFVLRPSSLLPTYHLESRRPASGVWYIFYMIVGNNDVPPPLSVFRVPRPTIILRKHNCGVIQVFSEAHHYFAFCLGPRFVFLPSIISFFLSTKSIPT